MATTDETEWIDVTEADSSAALQYALVIEWSAEDDTFVVSVPDIPGLHTHGATREDAATMGTEAIALWLAGARETGIRVPPPSFSALKKRPVAPDAARIRQIRQRLELSQQAFADLLNVSVATVRSWEQGVRSPDGASIRLLNVAERHPEALLSA